MDTIWQWTAPWSDTNSRMVMGQPKNDNGTGFIALELGDPPKYCQYCDDTISIYPHFHTKSEYDEAVV